MMYNTLYIQIIRIPDSGVAVQFVFIDTELLTRGNQACLQPATQDSQWTWIENTLAASIARWLFVLGHHPGKIVPSKCSEEEIAIQDSLHVTAQNLHIEMIIIMW